MKNITQPKEKQDHEAALISRFEELYKQHYQRLYYFLLNKVHSAAEAEDITHDTFLEALTGFKDFRNESGFYTWLCRIGLRVLARHYKKNMEGPVYCPDEEELGVLAELIVTDDERLFDAAAKDHLIVHALKDISHEGQCMLHMHFIDNMSHKEIGSIMGLSTLSVRYKLQRARRRLIKSVKRVALAERMDAATTSWIDVLASAKREVLNRFNSFFF